MKGLVKIVSRSQTLNFLGNNVNLKAALFNYIQLEQDFKPIVDKQLAIIEKKIADELTGMDEYIDKIDSLLETLFNPLLDFSVKKLAQFGCYDYDRSSFLDQYVRQKFDELLSIKEKLIDEKNRMENVQEQRNAVRVARREQDVNRYVTSRDRNNAQYSNYVQNGLGRIWDGIKNSSERSEIYGKYKKRIFDEWVWICYDMPNAVAHAITQHTGEDFCDPRSIDDKERARNIFKNLQNGNVPKEGYKDAALQVFTLDPATEGFLQWCVTTFGDPEGEFDVAAKVFAIDIGSTKEKILQSLIRIDSEEHALQSKEKLYEAQKKYSYESKKILNVVETALIKFDVEARTVEGVLYDTREAAEDARKQHKSLKNLISQYDTSTEENTKELLQKVIDENFSIQAANIAIKELNEKLVKFDLAARTVAGVTYDTRDEAENARKQLKTMHRIVEQGDAQTEDGIRTILKEMDRENLTANFAQDKRRELKNKLAAIDKEKRTVDGVEYKTRGEAEEAAVELEKLQAMLSKHSFDLPSECQACLEEISGAKFKTIVADKKIAELKETLNSQSAYIKQLQEKYEYGHQEVCNILKNIALIRKKNMPFVQAIDPFSVKFGNISKAFEIGIHEIPLVLLDIYGDAEKQGIILTNQGIHAKYAPSVKMMIEKISHCIGGGICGAIAIIILINILNMLHLTPGDTLGMFAIYTGIFLGGRFGLKMYRKKSRRYESVFIEWADVKPELSSDHTRMTISSDVSLPFSVDSSIQGRANEIIRILENEKKCLSHNEQFC